MNFLTFDTPTSHAVAREVLSGRSYPLFREFGEIETIVDVGANVGAASLYFAANYPGARVYAFEPSPTVLDLLQRNVAESSQIQTFGYGLADSDATLPLYEGLGESVAASLHAKHGGEGKSTPVTIRHAREALWGLGIESVDLLKIDTEGSELAILRTLIGAVPFRVLFVEYHDRSDRLELDRMLADTHLLFQGRIFTPDRGELCYVAKSHLSTVFQEI